jgi:hypothetical protein
VQHRNTATPLCNTATPQQRNTPAQHRNSVTLRCNTATPQHPCATPQHRNTATPRCNTATTVPPYLCDVDVRNLLEQHRNTATPRCNTATPKCNTATAVPPYLCDVDVRNLLERLDALLVLRADDEAALHVAHAHAGVESLGCGVCGPCVALGVTFPMQVESCESMQRGGREGVWQLAVHRAAAGSSRG